MSKVKTVTTTEAGADSDVDSEDPTIPPVSADMPHSKVVKTTSSPNSPWQRLFLSLVGIAIIYLVWERSTNHLYSLPAQSISAFTSLSTNVFYSIAVIVVFAITGKLVWDWKNSTAQTVTEVSTKAFEDIKEKIEKKEDSTHTNINVDLSGVIEQGQDGAPEIKPFSQSATK